MYEQDIELARLLLERLTTLDSEVMSLQDELQNVRGELQHIASVRDERSQYLDILTRAARLLDRADLEVESPPTLDLESRERELVDKIDEVNREALVYRDLIGELSQRAPRLVAVAGGNAAAAPPAEATEAEAMDEDEAAAVEESPEPVGQEVTGRDPFSVDASTDPAVILNRFNLNDLKSKETFTFGRGAAFVIDATSVLERVPHYDTHFRAEREAVVRDELIRDFDMLSQELSGSFHVVFSDWHQPTLVHGPALSIEYGTGEGEGTKVAGDRRLRELVTELSSPERSVCIITGDGDLADELRGAGRHIISLGDFFRT